MKHDYLSDRAANFHLMNNIKAWWRKRGFIVRTRLEKSIDPTNGTVIWVIRTNIVQDCNNIRSRYIVG
jgi:hypothetical protein